jgi:hypothetical protein
VILGEGRKIEGEMRTCEKRFSCVAVLMAHQKNKTHSDYLNGFEKFFALVKDG